MDTKYYKYLDGYRFIAVFLVILTHWLPAQFGKLPLGIIGVNMFFALSGFLITRILLEQKKKLPPNFRRAEAFQALKTFYVRRSLRIFPVYYLVILVFWLLDAPDVTHSIAFYLFYGCNYLMILQHSFLGMFTHLWSLAVEEQFYLVWPLLILFIKGKKTAFAMVGVATISLLYVVYVSIGRDFFQQYNTLSCLHVLAAGGLLAYLMSKSSNLTRPHHLDLGILAVCSILMILFVSGTFKSYFFLQVLIDATSIIVIKVLITRENHFLNFIFGNKPIAFLGKISYGLYLFHAFIPWLLRNLTGSEDVFTFNTTTWWPAPVGVIAIFSEQFVFLVCVATLSWYGFERPINNLKSRFTYSSGDKASFAHTHKR